jgi:hypothetical protein
MGGIGIRAGRIELHAVLRTNYPRDVSKDIATLTLGTTFGDIDVNRTRGHSR